MAQMERPHRYEDRGTSKVQVHQFPTVEQLLRGEASNWSPPTATGSTLVRDHHHELEDDHAHHHKKSVLTKVKEKAKKLRHSLSNKKKHNESSNTTSSWSVRLNEDDQEEEEDDAEYLGTPMNEPELASDEGKKSAKHHHIESHSISEFHVSPKIAKDDEKPLSPIKNTITETSPRDKTINEASPRNKISSEKSLRDKTINETSPRNKTLTETSPRNNTSIETSPRNKILTETSPRNKALTETTPINKTLTETSPRNMTISETSPKNSTLTETSSRNKTLTEKSPRNKTLTETFTEKKSTPTYNTISEKFEQPTYNKVSEKSGPPTPNIESEKFGQPTYNTESKKFEQPTYNTMPEKLTPTYNTISEKLAPAYASVSEKLAPAYASASDATHALASKLKGLTISTNDMNPTTQPKFTPTLRSFSTSDVREPLTTPTSPKSYSSPLPAQFRNPNTESTEQVWDKGVSVREYLMHKFEPGEDEKALSQVISEAISPKKSPTDYGVVDKVREAITSLLRNDDTYKTTSTNTHSTSNVSSPHLPRSTHAHEGIEEENHGRILQEN